jgi:hypothetical protein
LAWIVAVSMAFGGLTCTSFAENTDSSAIESSQDVDIDDGSEEDGSDDAGDSASEEAATDDVSIVDDSDEDASTDEASTDDENTDIVVIDDSEDDSTEDASDAASSSSSDDLIVIDEEDEKKVVDDATENISADKAAVTEVTVTKTFTYNGTAQQLTKDDFTVKVDGLDVDKSAYTLDPVTAQTNAGEYDAKITFDVEPYKTLVEGGAYSFKWNIAAVELSTVKISCDYSTTYGPTAKALAAALLKKAKEDKKITITSGSTALSVDDVIGFALALEDSNGVVVDGDTIPNIGSYLLTVDLNSLGSNYKLDTANITKGKFKLKEGTSPATENVLINASFLYGEDVSVTFKSTSYTSVGWVLKKGQKASTASEIKNGPDISINNGQASLSFGKELEANVEGESYFLFVEFKKDNTSSKKITKQFRVVTLADAIVTDSSGKNFEYEYTGFAITPTYTVTLNGVTLKKGTDFTESGDITKTEAGTYTVTLTGAGKYTGTKIITWTIVEKKSIADAIVTDLSGNNFKYDYTGSAITPTYTVTLNEVTLKKGTDFTESGDTSKSAVGSYTITLTGKGNYKGTYTINWSIAKKVEPFAINKSFVYNKSKQGPTADDLTYNGSKVPASDIQSFTCDQEIDAGEYSGTVILNDISKYPGATNPVSFKWSIEKKPIDVVVAKGHAQSQTYGKTADALTEYISKTIVKNSWVKITDEDNKQIKVKELDGFAIAITDEEGSTVTGDDKLPVGTYALVVDKDALDPNYTVGEETEGKLTIKGKGSGTVSVNETYTYGTTVSVKISSSDYTAAEWTLKSGESSDSAEEIDSNVVTGTNSISKTLDIKSLKANESGQHYFIEVEFSNLASSKDPEGYEDNITVTKQFDVTKPSIADATSVTGTISSSTVTWKKDNDFTVSIKYTTTSIAPTISTLTLNGSTLKKDTDFTVSGDTDKHAGTTNDQVFTIKLTGKGSYGGELNIKWIIQGSNTSSSTQNEPKLAGNGSVTAVTKSSRLDTLATTWQNQNPNKKKVYTINVTSIDRSNISEQAEDIISGLRDSSVVVECYDITVNEKVSSASGLLESDRNVNEFDTAIDIALTLGKANTSKNLVVIREHGSETAEMVKLDRIPTSNTTEGFVVNNGKVTIYSRYFSNFTLVYTSNSSGASISGGAGPDDSSSSGSRAPRTGDNLPVLWIWVLVLFAGVILTSVAAYESLKANKVKAPAETKKKR